jgi:hypothetical protein
VRTACNLESVFPASEKLAGIVLEHFNTQVIFALLDIEGDHPVS